MEYHLACQGREPVDATGYPASIAVRESGVWKKRMVVVVKGPLSAEQAQMK